MQSDTAERETMEFDVIIVGAGPAGLAAAIRLKHLSVQSGQDLSVVVLEKGSEVGAHILSGAVIDPVSLDQLIPDWKTAGSPLQTPVTDDRFYILGPAGALRIPNFLQPSFMSNHGCYSGSLGALCKWLAEQAEALGVEIYPGFAANEVLTDEQGAVLGVATGDMGLSKEGRRKESFAPGVHLYGKYTLIAEGARGSLAKQLIAKFKLDQGSQPQKYGIGLKEVWEIKPEKHKPGLVQHSMGWPLDNQTGGGSFLYHYGENLVSVGFVVHLNYQNPHLSPFDEFQKFKTHPLISEVLEGGKRLSYGARAITEGGWQSVPRLIFPGGALIGCAAGFVNLPRIKGSHNAMATGMMAAEAAFQALGQGRHQDELVEYQMAYEQSEVYRELRAVRNVKPLWSKFGTFAGLVLGGLDLWLNKLLPFLKYTLSHGKADHECLKQADKCKKRDYPKPDGILTFDRLSSVYLSGTYHEEDQPSHLRLTDQDIPVCRNLPLFDEPAQRYCPAGVYEIIQDQHKGPVFQINAQNCVHCKTCDIKDPSQNITWVPPEGGGGPNYGNM